MLRYLRWGSIMNERTIARVYAVARIVALSVAGVAAVSCSHAPSTVPEREPRTDAAVPLVEDAGAPGRDAAVRDAAMPPRTGADAAARAPIIDAEADLCAGTICGAPSKCEISNDFARCVCPAGMEFIDLGGDHSPCQAIPPGTSSDDGGDAADGG